MTYSVVAHCAKTSQYGIAIATYSPSVGARCPILVPGKGVASIQAVANPALNRLAAGLIQSGRCARNIVEELQASDPFPASRQLSVIDIYGQSYASTGANNATWAGHITGEGYACAGNVLVGESVVAAMAAAFEASSNEPLAERLMRSLEAGRDAGGQPEGQNSAALLLSGDECFPIVDLRVDLNDAPEAELRRIWDWHRPMVPYYLQRAVTPSVPRWWQWRMENVPGWRARHLGSAK